MNKKSLVMLVGILGVIVFASVFISAVCCEKLDNGGAWCATADDESQCDSSYNVFDTETCDAISVPECHGVCVNENIGDCSENTPELKCEEELGGIWHEEPIEDIAACQKVCCVLGNTVAFETPTQCRQLFSENGIQGEIREDITDRSTCEELAQSIEEGACVIETDLENTCRRTTESECNDYKENLPEGTLQYTYSNNELYIRWEKNVLCSGSRNVDGQTEYVSDCVKTKNTMCDGDKVYYVDSCGNKANVYDKDKYNSADYWTYLKNPSNLDEVCQIDGPSSSCGNCDVVSSSTVCQSGNAQYGNLICGDLSCNYNGEIKKHGESWCGGTDGTLVPIEYNFSTREISEASRKELEDNYDEYNIPGSRYYRMICSFGEILIDECADYRGSVCVQEEFEDETTAASCKLNTWETCSLYYTKSECENTIDLCKWVPGYRWDLEIVNEKNDGKRDEEQGSCVPLIAPGFDFWASDTQGASICSQAVVQDYALYETTWWISRDNFAQWGDKTQAHACLNGCYAIPKYGSDANEIKNSDVRCDNGGDCSSGELCFSGYCVDQDLFDFYDESEEKLDNNVEDYYLSDRRGAYCHKDGKPDKWVTGQISGKSYDCTPQGGSEAKDERKERDFPLFLTHQSWLNSITERARSLGDCGYKPNVIGEFSSPSTEIVTAIFEKLKQNQEVREKVTAEQIIYKAGEWVGDETEPYNEGVYESIDYSCVEQGGYCTQEFNAIGAENCPGEKITEGDNLCPSQQVCCVADDLE